MRDVNNIKMIKSKKIQKYSILKWLVSYLIVTVFLYFFGPINWRTLNTEVVVVLLFAYILFFFIGYKIAEKQDTSKGIISVSRFNDISTKDISFVLPLVLLGIFFDILMIVRAANAVSIGEIMKKVTDGLFSPSERYATFYNDSVQNNLWGGSFFSLLVTIGSPFCIAAIVLSVYYFPKIKTGTKVLSVLLILIHLGCKLISSANEGVFDLALYICVPLFLRYVNTKITNPKKSFGNSIRGLIVFAFIFILAVLAYSYFSSNITGRTKLNFAFATLGDNTYNQNNWLASVLPENLYATFAYFSVYLTEGYYGFSVATTLDWVPMYGSGFSSFIYNNIQEIFGINLFQYTYQSRVQNVANWGALRNFHTAYTFWANDVGFIGVVFVMLIIGFIIAKVYKKSIVNINNSCIVLMPLLITLVFYLPANNKVLIQPASFLLIIYIIIHWIFKRVIRIKRKW